jgi:hypothetical protein
LNRRDGSSLCLPVLSLNHDQADKPHEEILPDHTLVSELVLIVNSNGISFLTTSRSNRRSSVYSPRAANPGRNARESPSRPYFHKRASVNRQLEWNLVREGVGPSRTSGRSKGDCERSRRNPSQCAHCGSCF